MSRRHVVLVGLMGVGKTTVGRRVAKALGRSFVDADEGFIARYGCTIPEVFATDGEVCFRDLEEELVATLVAVHEPLVIATGGGAVGRPGTRALLAGGDCFTAYLNAPVTFLVEKAEAKAHRPLLAGADPVEVFTRLHAERDPWYREVAHTVADVTAYHSREEGPKKALALDLVERYRAAVAAAVNAAG